MPIVSIRHKLVLLAGIPVLGSAVLGSVLAYDANDALRKARALGTVENVAELSAGISQVVWRLQTERAHLALELGAAAPTASDPGAGLGIGFAPARPPTRAVPESSHHELAQDAIATDHALASLQTFLAHHDRLRLPPRLTRNLDRALERLDKIEEARDSENHPEKDPLAVFERYQDGIAGLIDATAALTELSDDGELLRTITTLVVALQLTERASREHALLAHVFAHRTFAPGCYRALEKTLSEGDSFAAMFQTHASSHELHLFHRTVDPQTVQAAAQMRDSALAELEDQVRGDPNAWLEKQGARVAQLRQVADHLNDEVRSVALAKRERTQRIAALGGSLASLILIFSAWFAWWTGRGISRGIAALRRTAQRVGEGDLDARVTDLTPDELGALGEAFNQMIGEVAAARKASEDRARMRRDLEIAASIQHQLLPPEPRHPDFDFAGLMVPADEMGGDFYDVLTNGSGALWLTVGDVSSHGISAGLVMVMAQAAFAAHFHRNPNTSPSDVIRDVNRVLNANIVDRLGDNKYLTAQLLVYQDNGRFHSAGAHEWPIVYRRAQDATEVIQTPGPWLGILPTLDEVPLLELSLEPGDVLCLYSDGLIEARNAAGDQFELDRFRAAFHDAVNNHQSLAEAATRIFAAVEAHADTQEDDRMLLLVRRVQSGSSS